MAYQPAPIIPPGVSQPPEAPVERKEYERITLPYMTKFEKARLIGERAVQIEEGQPLMIEVGEDEYDTIANATKELMMGKSPLILRRYLPDNTYEDWHLNELKIPP